MKPRWADTKVSGPCLQLKRFNTSPARAEWHSVCAYHIDAPGHTEGASDLSAELQASMTMEVGCCIAVA
jgi:hypothetical protein